MQLTPSEALKDMIMNIESRMIRMNDMRSSIQRDPFSLLKVLKKRNVDIGADKMYDNNFPNLRFEHRDLIRLVEDQREVVAAIFPPKESNDQLDGYLHHIRLHPKQTASYYLQLLDERNTQELKSSLFPSCKVQSIKTVIDRFDEKMLLERKKFNMEISKGPLSVLTGVVANQLEQLDSDEMIKYCLLVYKYASEKNALSRSVNETNDYFNESETMQSMIKKPDPSIKILEILVSDLVKLNRDSHMQ